MNDPTKVTTDTFNIIAGAYAEKYFTDTSDFEHIAPFINSLRPAGSILEAGCGAGQFSKYLLSKGFSVIGIDISEAMLAIARKKVPLGDFRCMDMRNLQFNDQQFDGIIAPYSLIHIPSDSVTETLRGFHRKLKPHGILCLLVQQGQHDHYVDEPLAPGNPIFFNFFTPSRIRKYVEESGFRDIKIQSVASDDEYALSDTLLYVMAYAH